MSHTEPRITFEMSFQDAVIEMCDGNPGAITAMMVLAQTSEATDPDSWLGPWTPLLSLDALEIYGSRIYRLYSDVCGRNATTAHILLRASQLGFISNIELDNMINNSRPIAEDILASFRTQVVEFLPNFKV